MGEKKDKIFYILPEQSTNEAENKFKYDMVIQQPLILQKKKIELRCENYWQTEEITKKLAEEFGSSHWKGKKQGK